MSEHVIIVGATSPLAVAASAGFLARGDTLSLLSSKGADLMLPPGQHGYSYDLNDLNGVREVFLRMVDENGPAERICFFQRYREDASNSWDGEYNVSLRATSRFIEEFQSQPASKNDKSIVIVSSPADDRIVLEQSASYHAFKAGLSQLVRYYAMALGDRDIRVNGVKPAIVLKPRAERFYDDNPDLVKLFNGVTPMGRMGRPADIANAVLFLSSPLASFITGQILSVDGGLSLHEAGSLTRLAASIFNSNLVDPRWKSKPD
jgi:NAD(P)-dependent dehydrogenase (short-subunit alcohol dehydrogenase family)